MERVGSLGTCVRWGCAPRVWTCTRGWQRLPAPRASVAVHHGTAIISPVQMGATVGGVSYAIPLDVAWRDSSGGWHQGDRPSCLPATITSDFSRLAKVRKTTGRRGIGAPGDDEHVGPTCLRAGSASSVLHHAAWRAIGTSLSGRQAQHVHQRPFVAGRGQKAGALRANSCALARSAGRSQPARTARCAAARAFSTYAAFEP